MLFKMREKTKRRNRIKTFPNRSTTLLSLHTVYLSLELTNIILSFVQ